MRVIKMAAALPAALALAWAAPVAATLTVNATVTGFLDTSFLITRTVVLPGPDSNLSVIASRMTVQANSVTAPYTLLGGTTPGSFVAFCIEPLELVGQDTPANYQIVPLSEAASGLGGIGETKANRIRELFGRLGPNAGYGTMTGPTSIALQLAIWEIVTEPTGTTPSIASTNANRGNFFARTNTSAGAATAVSAATTMLNALTGTGPMADGLFALRNGTASVPGSQDLLVFATIAAPPPAIPEPASWAMLIAGFGLTGAALRRRRAAVTSAG